MEIQLSEKLCQEIKQLELERVAYADLILKAVYEKKVDNETIEELKKEYLNKYYQLDELKSNIRETYNLNTNDWYLNLQNNTLIINIGVDEQNYDSNI